MQILQLSLFEGSWLCKTDKAETEEFWLPAKGEMMLGLNRSVANSGKSAFEFLRIFQQNNEIFYAASPNGREETLFKLIKCTDNKFIFQNLEHDFPQKIIYHFLNPQKMTARIEGEVKNEVKSVEWIFEKVDNQERSRKN